MKLVALMVGWALALLFTWLIVYVASLTGITLQPVIVFIVVVCLIVLISKM